jgi:hypothetical protein
MGGGTFPIMASSLLSPLFWECPPLWGFTLYSYLYIYIELVLSFWIFNMLMTSIYCCVSVAAHSPTNCFILIHSNNGWQAWIWASFFCCKPKIGKVPCFWQDGLTSFLKRRNRSQNLKSTWWMRFQLLPWMGWTRFGWAHVIASNK